MQNSPDLKLFKNEGHIERTISVYSAFGISATFGSGVDGCVELWVRN